MEEKRISHEGFCIKCDKCKGGKELIAMKSTTQNVTIGGKPIVTKMDKIAGVNITPFSTCDNPLISVCVPALSDWVDTAKATVNSEKFIPLIEHSEFICMTGGGKVTFSPPTAQSAIIEPKKPNVIDTAKAKINGVANKAAQAAKKATERVAGEVSEALEGLKPIGKIFDNTGLQNMIDGAKDRLEQANVSKKQLDVHLDSLEKKIPEIKSKISETIDGINIYTILDNGVSEVPPDIGPKEEAIIGQGIHNSIQALDDYFNDEITPGSFLRLDGTPSPNIVPLFNDKSPLETWLDQKNKEREYIQDVASADYKDMTAELKTMNRDIVFDDEEDSKKALSVLYSIYIPSQAGPIPPTKKGEISKIVKDNIKSSVGRKINRGINETKEKLNTKIQDKFDEELKKIGYDKAQQRIDKIQSKSITLQEDMNKASKWLGRMDDFDGFVNSLKTKYTDKVVGKYENAIKKVGTNLGLANEAMNGMSYAVNGFPAGDVVTNVKAKNENKKKEKNDDENQNKNGINKEGISAAVVNDSEFVLKAYWGKSKKLNNNYYD